ncbi:hypothetical protein Bbelb_128900 [Branchiostoma belcheri]|nr:hypothetical protein Bbelb_128900 [Branchiostoma belcheri]
MTAGLRQGWGVDKSVEAHRYVQYSKKRDVISHQKKKKKAVMRPVIGGGCGFGAEAFGGGEPAEKIIRRADLRRARPECPPPSAVQTVGLIRLSSIHTSPPLPPPYPPGDGREGASRRFLTTLGSFGPRGPPPPPPPPIGVTPCHIRQLVIPLTTCTPPPSKRPCVTRGRPRLVAPSRSSLIKRVLLPRKSIQVVQPVRCLQPMAPVTRACCLDTDRGDGVALLQRERPVFCGLAGTRGPLTCLSGYLTPLHRLKTADLSPPRDERHRDHRWVKGDNKAYSLQAINMPASQQRTRAGGQGRAFGTRDGDRLLKLRATHHEMCVNGPGWLEDMTCGKHGKAPTHPTFLSCPTAIYKSSPYINLSTLELRTVTSLQGPTCLTLSGDGNPS